MKPLLSLAKIGSCLMLLLLFAPVAFSSSNPYLSRHGINFSAGNAYLHQTDISLAGPILSLRFSRSYNSQSSDISILGYGWTFTWDERLIFSDNLGVVIHKRSDGSQVHFSPNGTDTWGSQLGKKSVIVKTEKGSTLTQTNGGRLFFDNDGRLIEQRDKNDNAIQLSYDGDKLKTVTDAFGRSLTLNYSTDSLLESVFTPAGTYSYGYDSKKNLISTTRPDGGVIRYLYEDTRDVHNLTGVIDAGGVHTRIIAYDNVDRVISSSLANHSESVTISYQNNFKRVVTNSQGVSTTYQLQAQKGVARVVSMTGPGCFSCGGTSDTGYVYNEHSQIVEATDANGVKTTYTYDANGNTTSATKAAGTSLATTTTKTYDPVTNQVATITRNSVANPGQSAVTTMTYDSHGNLLSRQESGFSGSEPINRITRYTYTATGQIASIDGPRTDVNDTVAFTYYPNEQGEGNNRGNLHTVTDALGNTTTFSDYNAFGQAQTVADANGLVTTRIYDGNGRLTATATAGSTTAYAYTAAGQLQTVTLPGNRVITYTYTLAGQIQKVADSLGNTISYLYDSEGRKTADEIRDPNNLLTRYASYGYDNHGNLSKVTLPGDAEENAEYDLVGNLIKTINATGMQTDYRYDDLHRLLATIEAGDNVAGYTYDSDDNVKTVKDAANHTTGYTMDDFSRRIATSAPDTGQTAYTYDAAGNLLTSTDAKNQTTT